MIKGIILDYGGTLDTGGDHWSYVIREGWEKAGVIAEDALFREAYVYGEQEMERVSEILPSHNFADVLKMKLHMELQYLARTGNFAPAAIEEKSAEIAAYCYGVAKDETAKSKEVLMELSKKYPLVLVSNFYGNLDTVLKDFGLYDCFKEVVESAKVGIRKPTSGILEKGINALGCKPEEVLVIGDSIKNDIEPARKLGCETLLLNGRRWGNENISDKDIATIDHLDEVFGFLEGK